MFFSNKKSEVIISDEKFNVIRKNIKLNSIPREGELIFFDNQKEYWLVLKIIYNISSKNIIWVIVTPQVNYEKS
jgi:hypothetical protein